MLKLVIPHLMQNPEGKAERQATFYCALIPALWIPVSTGMTWVVIEHCVSNPVASGRGYHNKGFLWIRGEMEVRSIIIYAAPVSHEDAR